MKVILVVLFFPLTLFAQVDVCREISAGSGGPNKRTLQLKGTEPIETLQKRIGEEFANNPNNLPYLIIEVPQGKYVGKEVGLVIDDQLTKKKGLCLLGINMPILTRERFSGDAPSIVRIQDVSNVVLRGFELEGKMIADEETSPYGLTVRNFSDEDIANIRIEENLIHSIGKTYKGCTGSITCGQAHGIEVNALGKKISDIHIERNKLTNLRLGKSEAITIVHKVSSFTVADNEIWDIDNIAIDIAGGTKDSYLQASKGIISGNRVHGLVFQPFRNVSFPFVAGIYIDGGTGTSWTDNIRIENNSVSDFGMGISVGSENDYCDQQTPTTSDDKCEHVLVQYIVIEKNVLRGNRAYGIGIGKDVFKKNSDTEQQDSHTWHCKIISNTIEGNVPPADYGQIHFGSLQRETLKDIEVRNNSVVSSAKNNLLVSVSGSEVMQFLVPDVSFSENVFSDQGGTGYVWRWGETDQKIKDFRRAELSIAGSYFINLPKGINGEKNVWATKN